MRKSLLIRQAILILMGLALLLSVAQAQTPTPAQAAQLKNLSISGKTLDGQAFDLAKLKGRVVFVMYWATDCAVCRDKMRELRENAKGWADKPFSLILISVDRRMSDVDSYNSIIHKSVPMKERLPQLWANDPGFRDSLNTVEVMKTRTTATLPLSLVIDKNGQVAKRYQGRIPAEVWDDIAELL